MIRKYTQSYRTSAYQNRNVKSIFRLDTKNRNLHAIYLSSAKIPTKTLIIRTKKMSAVIISTPAIIQHASGEKCSGNGPDTNALISETSGHENGTEDNASYTLRLKAMLTSKREVVLDFTSLKSCLDPQKEKLDGEEV